MATFLVFLVFAFTLISIYLILDYKGPGIISLKSASFFGISCLRTNELIVQEYDTHGNLWATKGLLIYCHIKDSSYFKKVARIPVGLSFYWLNNFSIVRRITLRPECVEMVVHGNGSICAVSSGKIWNSDGPGQKFVPTFSLPHFGYKVGRGVMSSGLLKVHNDGFFFGEYFSNPQRLAVRILRYVPENHSWENRYEFIKNNIRHIHSIQSDPFSKKLWICTGDEDSECMIAWTEDCFKTLTPVGKGDQKWRACQLVFTEDAVYWGADTGDIRSSGIYRWNRKNQVLVQLTPLNGAIFYGTRLAKGTIVFTSDREGFPNENDDMTRLFVTDSEDKLKEIEFGTWNHKSKGLRFNFGKLRLQRSQGNNFLAVSCLNLKEFSDGELLIFSEEAFNN